MDIYTPAERRMLVETIERYVRDRYAMPDRNAFAYSEIGWSPDHWRRFAELGVVAALFSEEHGGLAGTGHDIAAVFEALGGGLVVEPFLGTLMAGLVLAASDCGTEVEHIIAGELIVAFAHEEAGTAPDAKVATSAVLEDGEWRLSGTKVVVPQLRAAANILVSANVGGNLAFFLVNAGAPGLAVRDYLLIDGGRGGDLLLEGVPARLVGSPGAAGRPLAVAQAAGLLALCAEAVGIMDRIRNDTLDYMRTRRQFGVPLGSFQALKHRLATLALDIEQARSAVINAADALAADPRARDRAAAAAKFTVGRVGKLVAEEAIQLHGGIGMTWELPLSHFAKRLVMIDHQLGDADYHLDRYLALQACRSVETIA